MRWARQPSVSVDEENPYWMSFSDIMSALMVIFVLASVVLILQLMERQREFDAQIAELAKAEQVRRTILDEAEDELLRRGIQVQISENHTVLRIPNDVLGFETGAYEIEDRFRDTALEIGSVLSAVIRRGDRADYLDTVFVEGHTDNRPFNRPEIKGNWGLSTFRAISLWEFWAARLPDTERLVALRNRAGDPLFSVSGYGETRPVIAEQRSEADYVVNRRIDIRFTIRRPSRADYESVRGLFDVGSP
ncbi:MAG: chemotaxis protein MotB [Pseudomonadales bacterium]|jgi:flagellar motor protein MotB|nr:chemotaxis protein MotB [Pseudomonadales bacterium]